MNTRTKWTVASALAVIGGLSIAGIAIANPGFGHRGGPFHMIVDDMLGSIDTNADGAISQDEINAAIETRYAAFDANKDGKLSLEEFQALWADLTRPIAVRAFQFLDPNGDAVLDRAEVDKRFGSMSRDWTATMTASSRLKIGPMTCAGTTAGRMGVPTIPKNRL